MSEKEGVHIETKVLDREHHLMLVSVSGYVDQANCHLLQKTIDTCIDEEFYNLVFNLQELVYMSSAGWGVLIGEIKRFRESGGDIKLANMGPEIYEIYQMLEFYHIISEYSSLEEAVKSFNPNSNYENLEKVVTRKKSSRGPQPPPPPQAEDMSLGEDTPAAEPEYLESELAASASEEKNIISDEEIDIDIEGILASEGIATAGVNHDRTGYIEFDVSKFEREPEIRVMPIPDKVRDVVSKHPDFGAWKIRKILREDYYGNVKIGYFKLRSLLKTLELDTREKRYRFFRSA